MTRPQRRLHLLLWLALAALLPAGLIAAVLVRPESPHLPQAPISSHAPAARVAP